MQYRTPDIIAALERTHGMIYLAAKELGCNPSTIYRRADKNKEIQSIIDSFRGQLVDKAELKLEQAVMNGEPWAVTLTLKSLGKNRGYVERQEITGADGSAQKIEVEYINSPITTPGISPEPTESL